MDRGPRILTGGWLDDATSNFTRGFWKGTDTPIPPTPDAGGGASYGGPGQGESGRGYYVDWSLPRKRWIDREDEELLLIILDDDGY